MDIIDFLERRPFRSFVWALARQDTYPPALKPYMFAIHTRILAIHGFCKGYFNLAEASRLMLPGRFKTQDLKTRFSDYIAAEITRAVKAHLKDFIREDGGIELYGHGFYPSKGNYGELIDLVTQVCVLDQYRAKEHLKEGSIVFDIGANIGTFSVYAANAAKGMSIHSFEPVRKTFETLKENTSPYPGVACHNAGLGDVSGRKRIFTSENATVGSTLIENGRSADESSEEVQILTIDGFVREKGLSRVDFIKMDTEGYEAQILEGAKETIQRFRPVMAMSAYHHAGDREALPRLVESIAPGYSHALACADEEVLVFTP